MELIKYTNLNGDVVEFTANTALKHSYVNTDTNQTVENTYYVTDWGFGVWAKERLTEVEYETYQELTQSWSAADAEVHLLDTDETFSDYWKRFVNDPNVEVVEATPPVAPPIEPTP